MSGAKEKRKNKRRTSRKSKCVTFIVINKMMLPSIYCDDDNLTLALHTYSGTLGNIALSCLTIAAASTIVEAATQSLVPNVMHGMSGREIRAQKKQDTTTCGIIWQEISDMGWLLGANALAPKAPHSRGKFTLYARKKTRGKGKKKNPRIYAETFGFLYVSQVQAKNVQSRMEFGLALLDHLRSQTNKRRASGDSHTSHQQRIENKRIKHDVQFQAKVERLKHLAMTHDVETQMSEHTDNYKNIRLVDFKHVGNFIQKLVRRKTAAVKRDAENDEQKKEAKYLRAGLRAGTFINFVRPLTDDEVICVCGRRVGRSGRDKTCRGRGGSYYLHLHM